MFMCVYTHMHIHTRTYTHTYTERLCNTLFPLWELSISSTLPSLSGPNTSSSYQIQNPWNKEVYTVGTGNMTRQKENTLTPLESCKEATYVLSSPLFHAVLKILSRFHWKNVHH